MKKNKSLNLGVVNNRMLIVGVDSGKKLNYARFLFPEGDISKPFSFKNTRPGFKELKQQISFNIAKGQCKSVIIGIESTGHYWKPFIYHFDKMPGVRVVQVNPAHVKKAKEIYDSSPGKTDQKDPGVITMLVQMGKFQELRLPKGEFASLRVYARQREQKVTELGVQRNILHSLVDTIFPEYGSVFQKLEGKTSLYILEHYPVPEFIVNLGIKRLAAVLRKVSRGQLFEDRAKDLFNAASVSVGIKEGVDAVIFSLRSTIANIRRIQVEIEKIGNLLTVSLHTIPYAKYLLSMQGIGPVTLSIILGEIGNIKDYSRAEEIIKLAGLNLYEISSGQQRGRRRISKRGRPLLRKTLFFAAMRTVKTKGIFREDYLRLTETNKMQKTKALIALSRKLLRVIFALCRDNVSYGSTKITNALAA